MTDLVNSKDETVNHVFLEADFQKYYEKNSLLRSNKKILILAKMSDRYSMRLEQNEIVRIFGVALKVFWSHVQSGGLKITCNYSRLRSKKIWKAG